MYGNVDFFSDDFETVPLADYSCFGYGSLANCIIADSEFGRSSRSSRTICLYWIHFCSAWDIFDFGWAVYVPKGSKGRISKIKGTIESPDRDEVDEEGTELEKNTKHALKQARSR